MTKREIALSIILLLLLCAASFYFFYYTPKSAELDRLQKAVDARHTEVEAAFLRVMRLNVMQSQKAELESHFETFMEPVPKSFDDADALRLIERAVARYTGDINITFNGQKENYGMTSVYSVNLGFETTYQNLEAILKNLENENTANRVVNISYNSYEREGTVLQVLMTAEFFIRH